MPPNKGRPENKKTTVLPSQYIKIQKAIRFGKLARSSTGTIKVVIIIMHIPANILKPRLARRLRSN